MKIYPLLFVLIITGIVQASTPGFSLKELENLSMDSLGTLKINDATLNDFEVVIAYASMMVKDTTGKDSKGYTLFSMVADRLDYRIRYKLVDVDEEQVKHLIDVCKIYGYNFHHPKLSALEKIWINVKACNWCYLYKRGKKYIITGSIIASMLLLAYAIALKRKYITWNLRWIKAQS